MTDAIALLPCPFCGVIDVIIRDNEGLFHAECGECCTQSPMAYSAHAAKIRWNTRIAPDLAKMVEDMRAAKEALEFYGLCQVSKATVWGENGQPSYGIRIIHDDGAKARDILTRLKPYEKLIEKEGGE